MAARPAHADSVTTYSVAGNGLGPGNLTFSGTISVDTAKDEIQSVDLDAGGVVLTSIQTQSYSNGRYSGLLGPQLSKFSLSGDLLVLSAAPETYVGTVTLLTPAAQSIAPAPTPEPSSFLRLCTGLLGIFVVRRKRFSEGRTRGGRLKAHLVRLASACGRGLRAANEKLSGPFARALDC